MPAIPASKPNIPPPEPAAQCSCPAWRLTAWVAGVFTVLVGLGMLLGHLHAKTDAPLKSPRLKEYKEKLRLNPADEPLKAAIEQLDLQLRQRYFRQLTRLHSGVYLLLGGLGLFLVAASQIARARKRLPAPQLKPDAASQAARAAAQARWAVAVGGGLLGLFLLGFGLSAPVPEVAASPGVAHPADAPTLTATPGDAASLDELRQNWPRFRGADGSGVSASTNLPATWDVKSGAGVAWKTAAPTNGFNSPITWGGRVFFSSGDAAKREVFCLDGLTGQLLWRQPVANVPGGAAKSAEVPDTTGYAASSMASDGRRVYVIFANGDVAALTFEGKLVWSKSFGPLKNPYGHAASLATWKDRLILQLDQGDNEEGKSKLYALDGRTGQVVWQQPRKVGASWATPIVIEAAGKPQVITLAVPWVIAYAATDGAEIWRVEGLDGEITPSPIFAGGLVLAISPSQKLLAIRPDGRGDVTKTHVVWTNEDNVPDVTSPTSDGQLVFTISTAGLLTCFDLKDGKKQWEHDFDMECHASPSLAGNHLYLFSQKGAAVVVEAARQFKELFRTEMGDAFHASPAFAQDKIFLRGVTNIYCQIGRAHV